MSTFFSFFSKLLALDFAWILEFIISNLLWLFIFAVVVFVLFDGKNFFAAFVFLIFAIWLWGDFGALTGVGFIGAKVIAIYYISKIAILTIVESNKTLKKHLIVISTVTGLTSMVLANVFT